jgi:hypothetical protein
MRTQDLFKACVVESSGYGLQGSFTHDLTTSKVWLLQQVGKLVDHVDTVYILGSWYGNTSLYMILQPEFEYKKIINVEVDQGMLDQSAKMIKHINGKNVQHMLTNANKLDYRQLGDNGLVINTSLTDMPGHQWFDNIPDSTLVALQARDHDPNRQFHSTNDILKLYPLNEVLYKGSINLTDPETNYTRYMVIGKK